MVTKENRLIVPRRYRSGTYIGDNDVHKKIATAKRPDGGIAVLTSFFPDYPYYGVALCGAVDALSCGGWSETETEVIKALREWYAKDDYQGQDTPYPDECEQDSTAVQRFTGN